MIKLKLFSINFFINFKLKAKHVQIMYIKNYKILKKNDRKTVTQITFFKKPSGATVNKNLSSIDLSITN